MSDFFLQCRKAQDEDGWQYLCSLYPQSNQARRQFGDCVLATIVLDKHEDTMQYLADRFGLDEKHGCVMEYIQRHKDCDVDAVIKNLTGLLLCSITKELPEQHLSYIYLYALHPKLIKLYAKFGFQSMDKKDPGHMVAFIQDLAHQCQVDHVNLVPVILV